MRLLIEIPDEMYKTVQDGTYCGSLYEELKNGIPQETVTEFADRCRECGARYGKLLKQEPCEDWYDVPSDEMTLEQARQAVKDLRKKLAEHLEQFAV